jgi:formylglycine-generating enzyme required for sulfatase activity
VEIPSGRYTPFYASDGDGSGVAVEAFELDRVPVTVERYRAFVEAEAGWRRSAAPPVLVGEGYLERWRGDLDPGPGVGGPDRPVTGVSWFAAGAFCRWVGGRLPTTDEWEYVAQASETEANAFGEPEFNRRLLELHGSRPAPDALPPVGGTFRNALGVWDLHGLVWEWTADFNNRMLTGSGRDDQGLDRQLFCAAGSAGTTDPGDYAGFLRHGVRASLEGGESHPGVGFRCAYDPPPG